MYITNHRIFFLFALLLRSFLPLFLYSSCGCCDANSDAQRLHSVCLGIRKRSGAECIIDLGTWGFKNSLSSPGDRIAPHFDNCAAFAGFVQTNAGITAHDFIVWFLWIVSVLGDIISQQRVDNAQDRHGNEGDIQNVCPGGVRTGNDCSLSGKRQQWHGGYEICQVTYSLPIATVSPSLPLCFCTFLPPPSLCTLPSFASFFPSFHPSFLSFHSFLPPIHWFHH